MAASQRMSKPERRAQLLEAAAAIVAEAGTEALTLQAVAARAGVTKPIAYDHFGSREGALIALYRRLDEDQMAAARDVLANGPGGCRTHRPPATPPWPPAWRLILQALRQ